jgi:uncharacterized membrane protein HdeD (DUF308 family)
MSEVPEIARNWWMFFVLGLICVATGVAVAVWPDVTLLVFGIFAGISLMVAALLEIVDAVTGEPGDRALSAVLAAVLLIGGLICFRRPDDSLLAIVVAVGACLVVAGVLRIARGFAAHWWPVVAFGAVELIVGIVILAWPKLGVATLALIFAVTMIARGVWTIVLSLRLRRERHAAAAPVEQTATFA